MIGVKPQAPAGFSHPLRDLGRWMLFLVPLALLVLFVGGSLAAKSPLPTAEADVRSQLQADYRPWPFAVIRPVDPEIVEEIQRDREQFPEAFETQEPIVVAGGAFWATPQPPADLPTETAIAVALNTPATSAPGGTSETLTPNATGATEVVPRTATPDGTLTAVAPLASSTIAPTLTRTAAPPPTNTRAPTATPNPPTPTPAPPTSPPLPPPTDTAAPPPPPTSTPLPTATSVPTTTPTRTPTVTSLPTTTPTHTPTTTPPPTATPLSSFSSIRSTRT